MCIGMVATGLKSDGDANRQLETEARGFQGRQRGPDGPGERELSGRPGPENSGALLASG
jgi:hypothetical protein